MVGEPGEPDCLDKVFYLVSYQTRKLDVLDISFDCCVPVFPPSNRQDRLIKWIENSE